jgi:hypothetical protein
MKGIIFTEFVQMVEKQFGAAVADQMIVDSQVPSGGAYTSVGTYDHHELVAMVGQLSKITGIAAPDLVRGFGQSLFQRFAALYPAFFAGVGSSLDFLALVEMYIHPQVRKLYPDAELPTFEITRPSGNSIEMIYRSSRQLGDIAEGLIAGCAVYFGEQIRVQRDDGRDQTGPTTRFVVTRTASRAA